MSQPIVYNRVTSFTTDQAVAPTTPLSGANVDAELNGVKTTIDQILTNLAIIQRDDTHLANASVGLDQLDTTVVVGFNLPTAWVTAHAYAVTADAVFNGVKLYRCAVSHTSGTFATDLAAGKWTLLADFTPSIANASNVAFTPAQGIVATNTQAAVVEVKTGVDDITGFRQDISGGYTTAGNSLNYVLATGTPFASLAAMNNQPITFIPHATSAAAATLAVDGLAAKKIRTATGVDLTTGALLIGTPYQVVYYNGVGEFILTSYTEVFNNVTVNGTLSGVGNLTINTNKFTVAAASGNTLAAGTLDATGNFAVNTNKFTVAAASGNTVVAGTLTLGATSDIAVNTNKFTVAAASGNTLVAGTLGVTGDVSVSGGTLTITASNGNLGTNGSISATGLLSSTNSILSASQAGGGVGYATGAGGAVTQATNKNTNVTLNKATGAITMNAAALAANTLASFNMANSTIAANDVLVIQQGAAGTGTFGAYAIQAQCAAGSANIAVRNVSGGSLSEAIVLEFALIKGVIS